MFNGNVTHHLDLHQRISAMRQVHEVNCLSRRQLGKLAAAIGLGLFASAPLRALAETCVLPARNPIEGPYFLGDPEQRDQTGRGLVITGVVRDSVTCQPVSGARIVRWHANQYGIYEEYYRALMVAGTDGRFRLETLPPGQYANLDPHVHWYVVAEGYQPVIAQIQWAKGKVIPTTANFDFSLVSL
jgi:protocatechuate 3,4-dioxygenase beta subunit